MQTGNSLIRQYKEKKDKGCWVKRDHPQAYFIVCEESDNSNEINQEANDNRTTWWENENNTPRGEAGSAARETPLAPPNVERSRTASPYIENNFGGSGTIVRRRIIDQVPKGPPTTVQIVPIYILHISFLTFYRQNLDKTRTNYYITHCISR